MYARFIQHTSILKPANAFILLHLRVVRAKFVHDVSDCKDCLTFDAGRLPIFTKLHADTLATVHCVYNLIFAGSDVQMLKRTRLHLFSALALCFGIRFGGKQAAKS